MIVVRKMLEMPAVEMAAEEFGREQVDTITRAIEREAALASSKDAARFAKANEQFREAIFQAISNKALGRAIAQFNTHLHLIRSSTLSQLAFRKEIVNWHAKIRDAIQARNAALAGKLWAKYLDLAEQALIATIENYTPAQATTSGRAKASTRGEEETKQKKKTGKRQ